MPKCQALVILFLISLNSLQVQAQGDDEDEDEAELGKTPEEIFQDKMKVSVTATPKIIDLIQSWMWWQKGCAFTIAIGIMTTAVIDLEAAASSSSSLSSLERIHTHPPRHLNAWRKKAVANMLEDSNADDSEEEMLSDNALLQVQERRASIDPSIKPYVGYMTHFAGQWLLVLAEELMGRNWLIIMSHYFDNKPDAKEHLMIYYFRKIAIKWGLMWRGIALAGATFNVLKASGVPALQDDDTPMAIKAKPAVYICRYMTFVYAWWAQVTQLPLAMKAAVSKPSKITTLGLQACIAGLYIFYCHFVHIWLTAPAGLFKGWTHYWKEPSDELKTAAPYWFYAVGAWIYTKTVLLSQMQIASTTTLRSNKPGGKIVPSLTTTQFLATPDPLMHHHPEVIRG